MNASHSTSLSAAATAVSTHATGGRCSNRLIRSSLERVSAQAAAIGVRPFPRPSPRPR